MKSNRNKLKYYSLFFVSILSLSIAVPSAFAVDQGQEVQSIQAELTENNNLEETIAEEEEDIPIDQAKMLRSGMDTASLNSAVNIFNNMNAIQWSQTALGAMAGAETLGATLVASPAFPYIAAGILTMVLLSYYEEPISDFLDTSIDSVTTMLQNNSAQLTQLKNSFATMLNEGTTDLTLTTEQTNWFSQELADKAFMTKNLIVSDLLYDNYFSFNTPFADYYFYGSSSASYKYDSYVKSHPFYGYDYKRQRLFRVGQIMYSRSPGLVAFDFYNSDGSHVLKPVYNYDWFGLNFSHAQLNQFFTNFVQAPSPNQAFVSFINENTPYYLGILANSQVSPEELNQSMEINRQAFQTTIQQAFPENQFPIESALSGMTATLDDVPVVLNEQGQFVSTQTNEVISTDRYQEIHWGYNESLVTDAETIVIKGRPASVNEETGELYDSYTGRIFTEEELNQVRLPKLEWSVDQTNKLVAKLNNVTGGRFKREDLYTIEDLYMDESLEGHTIEKHINKSDEYLKHREVNSNAVSSYDSMFNALLGINLCLFQNIREGRQYTGSLAGHVFGYGYQVINKEAVGSKKLFVGKVKMIIKPKKNWKRNFLVFTSYPIL